MNKQLPGSFAVYVVMPTRSAVRIAEGLAAGYRSVIEPLEFGHHAIARAELSTEDRCSDWWRTHRPGSDPLGAPCGLSEIVVSESNGGHRDLCRRLGGVAVKPFDSELKDQVGEIFGSASAAMDAAGTSATMHDALQTSCLGARIVLIGMGSSALSFGAFDFSVGERSLIGSFTYTAAGFGPVTDWVSGQPNGLHHLLESPASLDSGQGLPSAGRRRDRRRKGASVQLISHSWLNPAIGSTKGPTTPDMRGSPFARCSRSSSDGYITGVSAYSAGVAAEPGYDIVGLRFADAQPVPDAFLALDRELKARNLLSTAVVGFELRSPEPVGPASFASFNFVYERLLAERGMLRDGVNPVARTNVAPVRNPPGDVVVCGAFVVRPSATAGGIDFVIAGSAEVAGLPVPENIVAFGDVSQDGLAQKADFVLDEMLSRITTVRAGTDDPNVINVYTAHEICGLAEMVESRLGGASRSGYVHWRATPPVAGLEFEMDCRHLTACEVI